MPNSIQKRKEKGPRVALNSSSDACETARQVLRACGSGSGDGGSTAEGHERTFMKTYFEEEASKPKIIAMMPYVLASYAEEPIFERTAPRARTTSEPYTRGWWRTCIGESAGLADGEQRWAGVVPGCQGGRLWPIDESLLGATECLQPGLPLWTQAAAPSDTPSR